MACGCIEKVNEKLASRNTRLKLTITFGEQLNAFPAIGTEQIETGRGMAKAIGMTPSFCPFCGMAYAPEGAAT